MAKRERFDVMAGRMYSPESYNDPETGERRLAMRHVHTVSFTTAYGIEYMHRHSFPDTPEGLAAAERLARRVGDALAVHGIAGLDMACWVDRVIYGSQAYSDEEPYIVAREKDDALLSEAFG